MCIPQRLNLLEASIGLQTQNVTQHRINMDISTIILWSNLEYYIRFGVNLLNEGTIYL